MKASSYRDCGELDRMVQNLDPLGADHDLAVRLPEMNGAKDVRGIVALSERLLSGKKPERFSSIEGMAALRDLGMIASSLNRHGGDLAECEDLESALLVLAVRTGEIPADTVTSYGPRNPEGVRMRTFTGDFRERVFIESFRAGMAELLLVLESLEEASRISIFDGAFGKHLQNAEMRFQGMVSAIVNVARSLTPRFFTEELRPYFEPKSVGGQLYYAPGGAQMPIIIVDQLLWGVALSDETLASYYNESLRYQPRFIAGRGEVLRTEGGLVQRAIEEMRKSSGVFAEDVVARQSLTAIRNVLEAVRQFRFIHLRVAMSNMALRPSGSVGSGGYDTELLKLLLERTAAARKAIDQVLRLA